MKTAIDEALQYASKNPGFRATLGIISTGSAADGILAWAALNENTGDVWVPNFKMLTQGQPEAQWQKLNPQQLRTYLARHQQTAFLYSEQRLAL